MPSNTFLAEVMESEFLRPEAELWSLPEEKILIEVDAQFIRDLILLAAIALQIAASASSQSIIFDPPLSKMASTQQQRVI